MTRWMEVRTTVDEVPAVLASQEGVESFHFFTEPWHPGGVVLRLLNPPNWNESEAWDSSPDERLFEDAWPATYRFFEAASRVALADAPQWPLFHQKLIHCALNTWSYDERAEARFAARMLKGRVRMWLHLQSWRWFPLGRGNCRYGCHRVAWR